MKKRIADIEIYNDCYHGEDREELVGRAFVTRDSDRPFAEFVLKTANWMLMHASGECTLTIRINPTEHKYVKKGEENG